MENIQQSPRFPWSAEGVTWEMRNFGGIEAASSWSSFAFTRSISFLIILLDTYAAEVLGIKQRLYLTQSWSLINEPGVGMHGHTHSNSLVSGSLYFTDLPQPVAGMIFTRVARVCSIDMNSLRS